MTESIQERSDELRAAEEVLEALRRDETCSRCFYHRARCRPPRNDWCDANWKRCADGRCMIPSAPGGGREG